MAKSLPLPTGVVLVGKTKTKHGTERNLYWVICAYCGQGRNITRHDHAVRLSKTRCKNCSNKDNHPQGETGMVRNSWFNKFKISANGRSMEWGIDVFQVANLLEKQGYKCVLSGLPIRANGDFQDITASIDRIDNSKGYTPDNIQLVHKRINMMRGALPVEEFISLCEQVADRVKW
jgi:hypothetical protein